MSLEGKRVLITGSSGFIGRNLIKRLQSEKADVINVGRNEIPGVYMINKDLTKTDFSFLDKIDFDYVVHLAGFSSPARAKDKNDTMSLNVDSTINFFNKLNEKNVDKVVFMSSCVVYKTSKDLIKENEALQDEPDFYAESKMAAERKGLELQQSGFPLVIFRLGNCYGPGQQWKKEDMPTIVPRLITNALINSENEVYEGEALRDYIYVDDVCEGIVRALQSNYSGVLNLGTGIRTKVQELAQIIAELTNTKLKVSKDAKYYNLSTDSIVLDTKRLEKALGWKPETGLREGIAKTIECYKEVVKKN
ncbi:NAD(P)-dependent oxidoreductase [Candidatus Pacearchaeota archaeon]|nr:NAD(P)-dependent oxidoreductase [Candidatus Pacearchaeota archaeon]